VETAKTYKESESQFLREEAREGEETYQEEAILMCSIQTLKKLFIILLPCWIIAVIYVASTPVMGVTPWGGWDGQYHISGGAMLLAIILPPLIAALAILHVPLAVVPLIVYYVFIGIIKYEHDHKRTLG
jgi:hypothetical protein